MGLKDKVVPVFQGKVEKGKLILFNQEQFDNNLLQFEGKEVRVSVRQDRKTRSDQQNRWYWGCIIPILADYCGYENDEMHEALKWKFLRVEKKKGLPSVRSTASLNTLEFCEYADSIVEFAARELGVVIPPPGDVEL